MAFSICIEFVITLDQYPKFVSYYNVEQYAIVEVLSNNKFLTLCINYPLETQRKLT